MMNRTVFIKIATAIFLISILGVAAYNRNKRPAPSTPAAESTPANCTVRECKDGESQIYLSGIGWGPCGLRCTKKEATKNNGKVSCTCPSGTSGGNCMNICLTFGDPCSTQKGYYQWTGCQ